MKAKYTKHQKIKGKPGKPQYHASQIVISGLDHPPESGNPEA